MGKLSRPRIHKAGSRRYLSYGASALPMGGIGTGCLDIEAMGVLGFSTILDQTSERALGKWGPMGYKGLVYRHPQIFLPFIGLAVSKKTWLLTTQKYTDGGRIKGCTELRLAQKLDEEWVKLWERSVPRVEEVKAVREIDYWGH